MEIQIQQVHVSSAVGDLDLVFVHTDTLCISPLLEQKPLAIAVSPTVLQSTGIRFLPRSVTFSPHMISKQC